MDKLGVNNLFLSATSSTNSRRFSLVPPFHKSPSTSPNVGRRRSLMEPVSVSEDDFSFCFLHFDKQNDLIEFDCKINELI